MHIFIAIRRFYLYRYTCAQRGAATYLETVMDKIALSIHEAARISGISRSRIYTLIGDGKIDARKIGRRTVVLTESVKRYIDSLPRTEISKSAAVATRRAA